jgi:acyl carrier protein
LLELDMNNASTDLTATEQQIAGLWNEVLMLDSPVTASDHFFALGGDSLAITMIVFRVNEMLRIDVSPGTLVEFPVLREFCAALDRLLAARS